MSNKHPLINYQKPKHSIKHLLVWFSRVYQVCISEAQHSSNVVSIYPRHELFICHTHYNLYTLAAILFDDKLTWL